MIIPQLAGVASKASLFKQQSLTAHPTHQAHPEVWGVEERPGKPQIAPCPIDQIQGKLIFLKSILEISSVLF